MARKGLMINSGDIYNNLTILNEVEPLQTSSRKRRRFKCKCKCGNIILVLLTHLRSGNTKSCGCNKIDHGLSRTRFHKIWDLMKQRCDNVNDKNYNYYGGKGIKYCHTWKTFKGFMNDMYELYLEHEKIYGTKQTTLDRINNDWGYSKENCRWADYFIQNNNRAICNKKN